MVDHGPDMYQVTMMSGLQLPLSSWVSSPCSSATVILTARKGGAGDEQRAGVSLKFTSANHLLNIIGWAAPGTFHPLRVQMTAAPGQETWESRSNSKKGHT